MKTLLSNKMKIGDSDCTLSSIDTSSEVFKDLNAFNEITSLVRGQFSLQGDLGGSCCISRLPNVATPPTLFIIPARRPGKNIAQRVPCLRKTYARMFSHAVLRVYDTSIAVENVMTGTCHFVTGYHISARPESSRKYTYNLWFANDFPQKRHCPLRSQRNPNTCP